MILGVSLRKIRSALPLRFVLCLEVATLSSKPEPKDDLDGQGAMMAILEWYLLTTEAVY